MEKSGKLSLNPDPSLSEGLLAINIQRGIGVSPLPYPQGLSIRAPGEIGPSSPITALSSVKLALAYLDEKNSYGRGLTEIKGNFPGGLPKAYPFQEKEKSVVILCPSPTEAKLTKAIIRDLGKENLNILAGEPLEFENFPKVPLVILDSALVSPHTTHPYAKGPLAKQNLIRALSLADGALIIVGDEERLLNLPKDGPLGLLFREATDKVHFDARLNDFEEPFGEVFLKAEKSIFCTLPPMNISWWPALSSYFLGALRRKVKVLILAKLPEKNEDKDYPGAAIRELRMA
jgi:hypothetical protein